MIVRNRISELRERAGMSLQDLAGALEISESHLGSLERRNANPSFGLALRICQVLGESMERVFPYGNADVGASRRGCTGTGKHTGQRGTGATGADSSPPSPTPQKKPNRESEDGELDLPRPIRARVLSDDVKRTLDESQSNPVGVLDTERAMLRKLSTYAEQRGYRQGYVYHKAHEEGLLFAYEHVLGEQSTPEGGPYGPQKARHPANSSPLLSPEPFPDRPAISTLSGTLLSEQGWREFSREVRYAKSESEKLEAVVCVVCGGIGRRHPTECHAIFKFLVEATEVSGHSTLNNDRGGGIQVLVGIEVLCPSCRRVRRLTPHDGPNESRHAFDRAAKHLEKVNRWTAEQAREKIIEVVGQAKGISNLRWTLDRQAAVGILEQTLGPDHKVVAEARERLRSRIGGSSH